ncbi:MAG: hypothetical protein DSY58_04275 [Desulfobulbus sp.]|nr:MAG: hypothetical protein DSY58_04275 [Desulfobulbus sp.]RUM37693.1 MAG: hypothetical protein DSY70_09410 [Desulfobulbus sp.]
MNKNLVIGILAAMLVLASLWGQINNKTKKALQYQMAHSQHSQSVKTNGEAHNAGHAVKAVHTVKAVHKETHVDVGPVVSAAEVAESKKMLEVTEAQLAGLREKFAKRTQEANSLTVKIAEKEAVISALTEEKKRLSSELAQLKKAIKSSQETDNQHIGAFRQQLAGVTKALKAKEQQFIAAQNECKAAAKHSAEIIKELEQKVSASDASVKELQAKLESSDAMVKDLQTKVEAAEAANAQLLDESKVASDYEVARAQVVGLEKIIEEKNAAIEETGRELDRLKVNMDVLLSRIADQQDALQEVSDENRELVQELARKNKELADANEQLLQAPVEQ